MENTKTLSAQVPMPKSVPEAFQQLKNRFGSVAALLETASITTKEHTQSIAMLSGALSVECFGSKVVIKALNENGIQYLPQLKQLYQDVIETEDGFAVEVSHAELHAQVDERKKLTQKSVFDVLRNLLSPLKTDSSSDDSTLLIGTFAFDIYELFESLEQVEQVEQEEKFPLYRFYLADTLLEVDHKTHAARIHTKVFPGVRSVELQNDYQRRLSSLHDFFDTISAANHHNHFSSITNPQGEAVVSVNVTKEEFAERVETAKRHIIDGDIFQIVLARDFKIECLDAFLAYRCLREANPSPYMFYIEDQDNQLFGASPESAVKFNAKTRKVSLYPIAGTRKRGLNQDGSINHDLDARIELELKNDEKERAEHLMLVDLGRNDIARVCDSGSRRIDRLMEIDRYSHVMHLVSKVSGTLSEEFDALAAYQACMNMGTLSGAPKVKATQLIRKIEQQYRGAYGGAMGYLSAAGDMDTAIVIRSAVVADRQATVSAGAGIVYDSKPALEIKETENKAAAVINAIHRANQALKAQSKSNGLTIDREESLNG